MDPNFTTAAQVQTLEKQELSSKKFDVAADTLQLTTVGNYLNLSLQAEQFISGSLDIVINQLLARVAYAEEAALAAEVARSTAHVPLAVDATGAEVRAAIFEAAALVYENTGALPEWIAMGPKRLGPPPDRSSILPDVRCSRTSTALMQTFVFCCVVRNFRYRLAGNRYARNYRRKLLCR